MILVFLEQNSVTSRIIFLVKDSDPELSDIDEKEDDLLDDEQRDIIKVF